MSIQDVSGETEGQKQVGLSRLKWDDTVNMHFKEITRESAD
jgi:hypothetical protein